MDFDKWAAEFKLSEETINALNKERINEEDVLVVISDEELYECEDIAKLPRGDRVRLRKAMAAIRPPVDSQGADRSSHDEVSKIKHVDSKSLKDNVELRKKLEEYEQDEQLLTELLGQQHLGSDGVERPSRPKNNQGKPLYITDFVTKSDMSTYDEETELLTNNGKTLLMRASGGSRKPKTREVTLSQWISANARIMSKLIQDGDVRGSEITDYLEYTARVGDMAQTHTIPSVMLFDERFRRDMAEKGGSWSDYNWHASVFHLEKRANVSTQGRSGKRQYNAKRPGAAGDTPSVTPRRYVCLDFNNEAGCQRAQCRFAHACAEEGCTGDHPQYRHPGKY